MLSDLLIPAAKRRIKFARDRIDDLTKYRCRLRAIDRRPILDYRPTAAVAVLIADRAEDLLFVFVIKSTDPFEALLVIATKSKLLGEGIIFRI